LDTIFSCWLHQSYVRTKKDACANLQHLFFNVYCFLFLEVFFGAKVGWGLGFSKSGFYDTDIWAVWYRHLAV